MTQAQAPVENTPQRESRVMIAAASLFTLAAAAAEAYAIHLTGEQFAAGEVGKGIALVVADIIGLGAVGFPGYSAGRAIINNRHYDRMQQAEDVSDRVLDSNDDDRPQKNCDRYRR